MSNTTIWDIFNDGFWLTIAGAVLGFLGLGFKICFESKCDNIKLCWGCINIHRAVQLEHELDVENHAEQPHNHTEHKI